MGSLFQGDPQKATSYVTSTTETPKWLQDAIYNQIYQSTNVANTPFTPYGGTLVAGATPQQKQAYDAVSANFGAFQPTLDKAQQGVEALTTAPGGLAAAQPLMTQAVGTSGVTAAQPYLQAAGETSAGDIQNFMNPYTQNVTDQIAKLGARNLSENLLPGVSDAFIRAGQFGGTRMGEFGSRALRDTQEAVLAQQGQALQTGYGQALTAAQQDAQRQAGLASTAGGLTQAQQQALMSAASQTGQLTGADLQRQQSALAQMAQMAQQGQQMRSTDVASLEAAGSAQQTQAQREADAAYQQYMLEQQYPKSQLDWLSTQVRGMAPNVQSATTRSGTTTGASYSASPLQQLATGLSAGAGLTKLLGS
jgi:hypothetical protein